MLTKGLTSCVIVIGAKMSRSADKNNHKNINRYFKYFRKFMCVSFKV